MLVAGAMRRAVHSRHRGFTLMETVVTMALVLTLSGAIGLGIISLVNKGHTSALDHMMDELGTLMTTAAGTSSTNQYPTDATNTSGTSNTGEASYDALATDLNAVATGSVPTTAAKAGINASTWTYYPNNTTSPASYTITATAAGGDGHVLCRSAIEGVVDLGSGGSPATPGVSCK